MGLLPRPMIFPLMMFISCCFCLGRASDCGGNQVAKTIIVDQQGKGAFKMIQGAIDSIKSQNDRWFKIHINPGIYKERVHIPIEKPCIILEGSGSGITTITYGDHQGTSSTGTLISSPPNVVLSGITFQNSFNNGPGVAATIYGDKSAIFECGFLGYQDTLLAVKGRHYFKDCYIQGEVDFIFGGGQSYFENCTMNATQWASRPPGFVTAQSRDSPNDPSGFVFRQGSVVGNGQVNLGRAWRPYSRVIFWGTNFSSVVSPEGWDAWNYKGQESKITFAEVNCIGPGANNSKRVHWEKHLSNSDLKEYSLSSFINKDEWLANIPTISL